MYIHTAPFKLSPDDSALTVSLIKLVATYGNLCENDGACHGDDKYNQREESEAAITNFVRNFSNRFLLTVNELEQTVNKLEGLDSKEALKLSSALLNMKNLIKE